MASDSSQFRSLHVIQTRESKGHRTVKYGGGWLHSQVHVFFSEDNRVKAVSIHVAKKPCHRMSKLLTPNRGSPNRHVVEPRRGSERP